jgi:hypothetical protein
MTDKELLELAAKAIGVDKYRYGDAIYPFPNVWDPLTDDGDCARLEAQLSLKLEWYPGAVLSGGIEGCLQYFCDYGNDKQKARRYASVRAAAEIGKQKE